LTLALLLATLMTRAAGAVSARPVSFAFVGDVMLGREVAAALDGDWAAAFADVRPWLACADVAIANLESPLTRAPFAGGRFDLRAAPEAVEALITAGIDVVSLANNHALDGGPAGLAETRDVLRRAGVRAAMGSNIAGDQELRRGEPVTLQLRDLRVAVLAFLDSGDALNTTTVARAAVEADLVVVVIHWGAEYYPVTARQRAVAQELAAAGADLIIGQGPHVLQPIEVVNGALVAYSLGNSLFDQPFSDTRQGAILQVTVNGVEIVALEVVPTLIQAGRVRVACGTDAAAILKRLGLPASSGVGLSDKVQSTEWSHWSCLPILTADAQSCSSR
jgi:poly-gamma-glutamate synthesis protein (capsule biosynthesis protein)